MIVTALFIRLDGARERHEVDPRRDVWQEYETPFVGSLGDLPALATLNILTFRRERYAYPADWSGPLASHWVFDDLFPGLRVESVWREEVTPGR